MVLLHRDSVGDAKNKRSHPLTSRGYTIEEVSRLFDDKQAPMELEHRAQEQENVDVKHYHEEVDQIRK